MVAYSFNPIFAEQVAGLTKRQTVRADRRNRHAMPGERIQLYTGMRTRHCRKLLDPDPICTAIAPIEILLVAAPQLDYLGAIAVNDRWLDAEEIERFAISDGFGIDKVGDWKLRMHGVAGSARYNMGAFWHDTHGLNRFSGSLIHWTPVS